MHTKHLTTLLVTMICWAAAALTSCDSVIYDNEGDCEPHYRVRFVYDRNMKFADAFAHEVNSVTLRLLDADGRVVWQRTESGDALSQPDYAMDVNCPPGTYTLHVWAEGHEGLPFLLADDNADQFQQLTARLPHETDADGNAVSDERLRDLYHGYVASVTFSETEGTHTHTVQLTKDTNYLRVVLQQTSAEPLDPNELDISITDDNGYMNADNLLRPNGTVTYRPWAVTPLKADVEDKGVCDGVLAEFTVPRLMADRRNDTRLTVRNGEKTIFSVRLIDFLLMTKGNYNHDLTEQEYLDFQDVWDLTFFLDEGQLWLATYIYINSWRVVLQNEDLN